MRIVGMVMIALGILNVLGGAVKAIGAMALTNDIGRGVVAGSLSVRTRPVHRTA